LLGGGELTRVDARECAQTPRKDKKVKKEKKEAADEEETPKVRAGYCKHSCARPPAMHTPYYRQR
jgi:hypothetical protein